MLAVLFLFVCLKFWKSGDQKLLAERFEASNRRLQDAVSELMARANEIDQESKFLEGGLSADQSERLQKACSELVILGDAVDVIETRLSQRDLKSAEQDLLITLGAADKIRTEISEIREEIRQKRISG